MDRGFRRGRQEDLRAAHGPARHAREARSPADRVSQRRRGAGRARAASPAGTSFDDLAKERGLDRVRRRPRHDHEIRDHRSRDRRCRLLAALAARSASRCRAVSAWRWSRSARSSRARCRPTTAWPRNIKKEIATERARAKVAELHNKMEDERGGGASVDRGRAEARAHRRHDRRRRPLRPHAERPAGRTTFRAASTWSRRPSTAMSASTTTRSSSTAAMSGTTCSASRRRASAISTRSATRSRRAGARTRSRARLRTKATEMVQKLEQRRQARRRSGARSASRSRPPPASSATPRCPACPPASITAAFRTAKDGVGQAPAPAAASGSCSASPTSTCRRSMLASDEVKKLKDTLQRGADRRAGRAIRHQARNPTSAPPSIRPPSRR